MDRLKLKEKRLHRIEHSDFDCNIFLSNVLLIVQVDSLEILAVKILIIVWTSQLHLVSEHCKTKYYLILRILLDMFLQVKS